MVDKSEIMKEAAGYFARTTISQEQHFQDK